MEQQGVKFGWDDDRTWFNKLGREFGFTGRTMTFLSFPFGFISAFFGPWDNADPTDRFVYFIFFTVLIRIAQQGLCWIPTWLYRIFWGKMQYAFMLDGVQYVQAEKVSFDGFRFPMQSKLSGKRYLRLGFGLLNPSAILENGFNDVNAGSISTRIKGERMVSLRRDRRRIDLPLDELLTLMESSCITPDDIVGQALRYRPLRLDYKVLADRVNELTTSGFAQRTTSYLRSIIADLSVSNQRQRSRVGERERGCCSKQPARLSSCRDGVVITSRSLRNSSLRSRPRNRLLWPKENATNNDRGAFSPCLFLLQLRIFWYTSANGYFLRPKKIL